MKTIEVTIKGTSPLLMHAISPEAMLQMMKRSRKTTEQYDPKVEAEQAAYKTKAGELMIPARCLKASLVNASSWYKMGKKSAKQYFGGSIFIQPLEIPLGTKKYEIDLRTVVIQRNRIVRARPRIDKWQVTFNIIYNDKVLEPNLIKQVLEESGIRIGLLDFRPQRGGDCGQFEILNWKEIN